MSVAAVTVSVVLPETVPDAAVIVTDPTATEVARPLELTAATEADDDVQVTESVSSWFVPSE